MAEHGRLIPVHVLVAILKSVSDMTTLACGYKPNDFAEFSVKMSA